MSLLAELDAFYAKHRRCGELDRGSDGAGRLGRTIGASPKRELVT